MRELVSFQKRIQQTDPTLEHTKFCHMPVNWYHICTYCYANNSTKDDLHPTSAASPVTVGPMLAPSSPLPWLPRCCHHCPRCHCCCHCNSCCHFRRHCFRTKISFWCTLSIAPPPPPPQSSVFLEIPEKYVFWGGEGAVAPIFGPQLSSTGRANICSYKLHFELLILINHHNRCLCF